ncbi:MAG TPA: family 16 glycosylhydrolase [Draconibacterium sp.]|nr:family 16 glycosylhydrolase [Draconibacterium sp.]
MKKIFITGQFCFFLLLMSTTGKLKSQETSKNNNHLIENASETIYKFNKLVWSDEFNMDGAIDASKWFHQTKIPNGTSWYNNEIQHYTNRIENSFTDSGYLHIVAKKETFTDQGVTKQYTSARLNSKFAFTYGKVVIRAKLPFGPGTWPALWTMGKNVKENGGYWFTQGFGTTGWPACGEIDMMEHWGTNQNYVSSAIHTPSSSGNTVNKGGRSIPGVSTGFHIYTFEWTPEKLVFSVDDIVHYTYNPAVKNDSTWPFDKEQYFLLNVAVLPAITTDFTESSLVLDYIRVYQDSIATHAKPIDSGKTGYFPNPFDSELSIHLGEIPQNDVDLRIYDINSRLVKTYNFDEHSEKIILNNLGNLPGGTYLIHYKTNNKLFSFKALKK